MIEGKSNLKEKLRDELKDLFQLDSEDLNFGIYRIMNYRQEKIKDFIEKGLIEELKKQLESIKDEERKKDEEQFEKVKQEIIRVLGKDAFENGNLKDNFKSTPLYSQYYEKKKELEESKIPEDLEKEIYNHLINFFSRYYDKGDFMSKRRYGKKEKYVIPYNGEEVYLYWANKDQYYVKTTEYFRKYVFRTKGLIINFRVVEAQEEQVNIKSSEKKFFVLNKSVFDFDNNKEELNIYFEYRRLKDEEIEKYKKGKILSQDNINEDIIQVLRKQIPKLLAEQIFQKEGDKTIIENNLYKYTRRNTTNYFIHRDLKGFLDGELDFYIKNEFLNLDELQILDDNQYFDKLRFYMIGVRAFRNIASKIIEFLAQIENFQKKIWEKKKFIIDTHYVISLDKINKYAGEEFLESILDQILSNERQLQEWKELFGIKVAHNNDLISNNTLQSKEWKKLSIDTKYFDDKFKWELLVALSDSNDLDKILDGVLIKSENFQALNLLLNKYSGEVKTIYIDPPYNTGSDEFIYKDNYQDSSWLTMLENRINIGKQFLTDSGIFFSSIADNSNYYHETPKLQLILENLFINRMGELIWKRRSGSGSNTISGITEMHEHILCFGNERSELNKNILTEEDLKKYTCTDKYGKYFWNDTVINQYTKEERPNLYYPIYYNTTDNEISFHHSESDKDNIIPIYPSKDGKSVFFCQANSMEQIYRRGLLKVFKENTKYELKIKKYLYNPDGSINGNIIKSVIEKDNSQFKIGGTSQGTNEIKNMFGKDKFKRPKPSNLIEMLVYISTKIQEENNIVLDFFAGSGTTAHAVMKLNKDNLNHRKFILIEMGDYFYDIIIPRIKKVGYSLDWKGGKPENMNSIGVFFKYQTLEQYEDALENIEFEEAQKTLYNLPDYVVKYMLDWETKDSNTFLNLKQLDDPFNYQLKIIENYQPKNVNVDLVETFNYLLGLNINRYKFLEDNGRKYIFVFGDKKSKRISVVWRSLKNIDLSRDKEVVDNELSSFNPDEIYINGDALVKGFKALEPLFKSLMFKRVN